MDQITLEVENRHDQVTGRAGFFFPARDIRLINAKNSAQYREIKACDKLRVRQVIPVKATVKNTGRSPVRRFGYEFTPGKEREVKLSERQLASINAAKALEVVSTAPDVPDVDVSTMNIKEVWAAIDSGEISVGQALEAEKARQKPRITLVLELEKKRDEGESVTDEPV